MSKDFKDTLNLPQTDFPMKANLPSKEPAMLEFWEKTGVAQKIVRKKEGGKAYLLHDGPPYANGHIHIGHALNKILKDIVVKYKSMQGFHAPYVPGWDCHGLPIELEVDKKLGSKKRDMDVLEKRRLCREYAKRFVDIQREEFKRLGVFGDWDKPYLTMTFSYEAAIVEELLKFVKNGSLYRGKKPVHWCPSCVTALAEAEVEYADKTSPSIFVRFKLESGLDGLGLSGDSYMVIWTTTPWTLPANLALAVNPGVTYVAVNGADGATLIVAEYLLPGLVERGIVSDNTPLAKFKGEKLVGLKAKHPFVERDSVVIGGDFVSTEEGTGIVHIAPGHGEDDYAAGLEAGLDIFAPVNKYGKFAGTGVEELEGQFVFKANETVLDILKDRGALLHEDSLAHSYPHCWRCKKPVIFRATEQWFISMENNDLRKKSLEEIDRVAWVPTWGKDRISGMVQNRPDWCISRQRAWGVPIAVLTCGGCGSMVTDPVVLEKTVELVAQEGADVWFTREAGDFLPQGFACADCGGGKFEKEMDILDVWFESGVSHAAVLNDNYGLSWPADIYLEGSDQHRGWFQSSLLASVGARGTAPYKTVLTHGFTVDGQGKKMSKSVGNVVAPQDIIKSTGAEILRLWVSAEDYQGDVRISKEIIARLIEAYRKIRNTARYLLGNTSDFPGGDRRADMLEVDRWAASRLQGLIAKVTEAYESFDFHAVYRSIYHFCIVDMSNFYLDILKDRLYTFGTDSAERRAAQWVLSETLSALTRLMAPVLSFTSEEIWQSMKDAREDSVFLAGFPEADESLRDEGLEKKWEHLIALRNDVNKAMEVKRQQKVIGNSLEAKVTLYVAQEDLEFLEGYRQFLPTLLIVSQAELGGGAAPDDALKGENVPGLAVSVEKAEGQKCQRCWNWLPSVGTFEDEPEVCEKCHGHMK